MNCSFLNINYIGLLLIVGTLVMRTQGLPSITLDANSRTILMPCTDSVQIDSVYAANCSGSGPYTADWKIIVTYSGLSDEVVYQRNSQPTFRISLPTVVLLIL